MADQTKGNTLASVHTLTWTNPTQYTDGTTYASTDNAGYTLQLDGVGVVSIPLAWDTKFDMATLAAFQALKRGPHTAALAVVSKAGEVSAFSSPASFSREVPAMAPTNLSVV